MNYFFKKRHTRLLSLLLALCMVASMLAGCQRGEAEDTSTPTEENLPSGLVEVKPTEAETQPPETVPEFDNIGIISDKVDQLNVKSSPSSAANTIAYLDPGMEVEIIKIEEYMNVEWALIRQGWILMEYVEMKNGSHTSEPDDEPPAETKPAETEPTGGNTNTTKITGTVTANGLYIRKEPNANGEVVGSYKNGTSVIILETKNGWGRTEKGWISMTYVDTDGKTNNNTNTDKNTNTTTTGGTAYFITASQLNIRDEASVNGKQVGSYTEGDRVIVLETSNGWGKTDKGWISLQYAYKPGTTGTNTAKGLVTGEGLNIRSGPGTGYASVGNYGYLTRVNILEQVTIGDATWGCTDKGWISMGYVYVDGTKADGAGEGTVTGDNVNIRSGPGTGYASVGSLNSGDTVEILAQFEINDMMWGCIKNGWVCMDYVGVG